MSTRKTPSLSSPSSSLILLILLFCTFSIVAALPADMGFTPANISTPLARAINSTSKAGTCSGIELDKSMSLCLANSACSYCCDGYQGQGGYCSLSSSGRSRSAKCLSTPRELNNLYFYLFVGIPSAYIFLLLSAACITWQRHRFLERQIAQGKLQTLPEGYQATKQYATIDNEWVLISSIIVAGMVIVLGLDTEKSPLNPEICQLELFGIGSKHMISAMVLIPIFYFMYLYMVRATESTFALGDLILSHEEALAYIQQIRAANIVCSFQGKSTQLGTYTVKETVYEDGIARTTYRTGTTITTALWPKAVIPHTQSWDTSGFPDVLQPAADATILMLDLVQSNKFIESSQSRFEEEFERYIQDNEPTFKKRKGYKYVTTDVEYEVEGFRKRIVVYFGRERPIILNPLVRKCCYFLLGSYFFQTWFETKTKKAKFTLSKLYSLE